MKESDIIEAAAKGASAPLSKLVEVAAQGIGKLLEPVHLIRQARARKAVDKLQLESLSDALENRPQELALKLITENPQVDADAITRTILNSQVFARRREIFEYSNVESILGVAAEEIIQDGKGNAVSDKALDPDWIARFFSRSKDFSRDDAQKIWGKLLAREIRSPGAFSLRTLDVLSALNPDEAALFTKLAKYAGFDSPSMLMPRPGVGEVGISAELTYGHLLALAECGLLNPSFSANTTIKVQASTPRIYRLKTYAVSWQSLSNDTQIQLPSIQMSKAGVELLSLVDRGPTPQEFVHEFKTLNTDPNIRVQVHPIRQGAPAAQVDKPE